MCWQSPSISGTLWTWLAAPETGGSGSFRGTTRPPDHAVPRSLTSKYVGSVVTRDLDLCHAENVALPHTED